MTLLFPRRITRFLLSLIYAAFFAWATWMSAFVFEFNDEDCLYQVLFCLAFAAHGCWRGARHARYVFRRESVHLDADGITLWHNDVRQWRALRLPWADVLDVWTDNICLYRAEARLCLVWRDGKRVENVALRLPPGLYRLSNGKRCRNQTAAALLAQLAARGNVSVSGCTRCGDKEIPLKEIGNLHDSIILLERLGIVCSADMNRRISEYAARGNVLLQEMDDHPQISDRAVRDNYFLFRAVSAVQTSTQYLADFLRQYNPYVYLFENQLAELPAQRSYDMPSDRVTIFFGALNRRPDWEPLMPALNEAIRRYGDRLYFRVVSDHGFYQELQTEAKEFAGGVRDASIVAPYEHYTAALHASDIALLPLNDTEFNRAKSDLKFIEAAGHGAAVLASPTVYAGSVRDGETGLIFRSPKEFAQKLDLLIKRSDLRRTLAENAYRYVAEHRLLAHHLDDYIAAYREMFARREELERERLRRVESFFPQL